MLNKIKEYFANDEYDLKKMELLPFLCWGFTLISNVMCMCIKPSSERILIIILNLSIMAIYAIAIFERNKARHYKEEVQEEMYKSLKLALFSDKIHTQDLNKIWELQDEIDNLKKYKPEFKAVRRWRV